MEIKGLRDSVTDAIRTQIIARQLEPGQRLNEAELCEAFNVSRSPLRESLLILEGEDLVKRIPRRGTYVTEMNEANLREIYQVAYMVEMYAMEQLEEKGITDVPAMEAAIDQCNLFVMSDQDGWKDLVFHRKILASFHARLAQTLENRAIILFYRKVSSSLARYQYLQLSETRNSDNMIKEHRQIIECIKKGDYGEGKKLLRRHIGNSFQYKLNALISSSTLKVAG